MPEPEVDVVVDYESSRERYQGKAEFLIASLHLCGNTGTYVDAPTIGIAESAARSALALERLADLETVVVDCTGAERAIGADSLSAVDLRYRALLIRTDFSRLWGTDAYFSDNPFLTADACEMLVRQGVSSWASTRST